MSPKTRDVLILIGGIVGILLGAFLIGLFAFAIFNGYVVIPDVTLLSFWSFITFLLTGVAIPYLTYRITQLQRSSQQNGKAIEQAHQAAQEANYKLENGIKSKLDLLVRAQTDQLPGGRRDSDPPMHERDGTV